MPDGTCRVKEKPEGWTTKAPGADANPEGGSMWGLAQGQGPRGLLAAGQPALPPKGRFPSQQRPSESRLLDAPTSHSPRRRSGVMDWEWPAVGRARPGAWGGALGPSRGRTQVERGGSGYRSGEGGKPLISSLTPCDFLPLFNPEGTLPPYV